MVNCYEFCVRSLAPTQRGGRACAGILRTTLESGGKKKEHSGAKEEKKREEAVLRRGLNGFTICFGGAGSCIITCLLVHRLSSSVSQLKQPSVCSYFGKGVAYQSGGGRSARAAACMGAAPAPTESKHSATLCLWGLLFTKIKPL